MDETNVSQERRWLDEGRARMVVKNLQRRGIDAQYVASRREALAAILGMIPPGVVVARGDSVTFDQVGVVAELVKRNQNKLIVPLEWDADGTPTAEWEQRFNMMREAFFADIFLTGVNALTLDGKLVSIDGLGNRVSAMIFGPKKVIIVAGVNKIVKGVNEALARIHEIAAPMNARRHYLKHNRPEFGDLPCVRTGICVDCNHPCRICNYTVIIEGQQERMKDRINVVIVGEELGI